MAVATRLHKLAYDKSVQFSLGKSDYIKLKLYLPLDKV